MLIGLVGKPSAGKSTFFKSATLADVGIASYAFTTIKPNHGVGYVKIDCIDKEFNVQCQPRTGYCKDHIRFVPVDIMDVAGLVPGASQGRGLGNQFLDDLRQADVFIHIVDMLGKTDSEGKPVEDHDPLEDIKFLENELDLWYLGIFKKVWKTFSRSLTTSKDNNFSKSVVKQFSGLKVCEDDIKDAVRKSGLDSSKAHFWNEDDLLNFASCLRKISKPMIIAANKIDNEKAKKNYERIKSIFIDSVIIPCSADSELALREASKHNIIEYLPGERDFKITEEFKDKLNEKQKIALENIKTNVLDVFEEGTGVQKILNYAVFSLLEYIAIFPASPNKLADSKGNILPDCFLLPKGSTALDFAYYLHTDIGKNFIKAIDARTSKVLGKDHILKHRDALEIVI